MGINRNFQGIAGEWITVALKIVASLQIKSQKRPTVGRMIQSAYYMLIDQTRRANPMHSHHRMKFWQEVASLL